MAEHFVIDMLPGREGDCLWLEYGDRAKPRRILVDGGRQIAYETLARRFAALAPDQRVFELLVCTHVDADHIEGLLKLVEDPALPVRFKDVWFNSFVHLRRPTGGEAFGAKQGERLGDGIVNRRWHWNKAFDRQSVVVPDCGPLPQIRLTGGMTMTLLSPTWDKLEKLRPVWKRECERAGMVPGRSRPPPPGEGMERFGALNIAAVNRLAAERFKPDRSPANGASIAFLASYGGKSALLTGDAHASVLAANLKRLDDGGIRAVDVLKLSHHGSQGTLSPALLDRLDCHRFLISTDGSRHQHPDRQAMARVLTRIAGSKTLIGNYRSRFLREWDIRALRQHFDYKIVLPVATKDGVMRERLI